MASVFGMVVFCGTELFYMFVLFLVVLIPFAFYNLLRTGLRWREDEYKPKYRRRR
ncbi:MAG: hypothetical protein ABIJ18_01505 [archaeon]